MMSEHRRRNKSSAEREGGKSALTNPPVVDTKEGNNPSDGRTDEKRDLCTDVHMPSTAFNRLTPNDREALEKRFFVVVSRRQLSNVKSYLDSGVPVDTKDEHGSTALHIATQCRYASMQHILLEQHADPNAREMLGRNALHLAADNGDVDTVRLLIAYGGKVNSKDKAGNSPLHCAVSLSQKDTIDILVFCGADGYQRNAGGMSPVELSASHGIRRQVQLSKMTAYGLKTRKMKIQNVNIVTGQELYLNNVELRIKVLEKLQRPLGFLCRRSEPEYSPWKLRAQGKELLLSDSFEYRLTDTATDMLETWLQFPVYEKEEPYEIVYLKTDKGDLIEVSTECIKKVPCQDVWLCEVRVDLKRMSGFVIITSPKVERIDVGSDPMSFTSSVDPGIKLTIPGKTFEEGNVHLQVLPCVWYRPDEYDAIVSLTYFYDVSHSHHKQPNEKVAMTTPYPLDYHVEAVESGVTWNSDHVGYGTVDNSRDAVPQMCEDTDQLVIFTSDADSDVEIPEDKWQIVPSRLDKARGRISFDVSHFSVKVPVQVKRGASMKHVKRQISQLHKRSIDREHSVVFLGLLKPIAEKSFQLAVECTMPKKVRKRLKYWVTDMGFIDQKPSATGEFKSKPSTEYTISLSANLKFNNNALKGESLMFQPKGCHSQTMKIELSDCRRTGIKPLQGNAQNTLNERTDLTKDSYLSKFDERIVEENNENVTDKYSTVSMTDHCEPKEDDTTSGEVYFSEKENPQNNITQLVLFLDGLKKQALTHCKTGGEEIEDFNGFTCNDFLKRLSAMMTTEWMRIAVRLGISHVDLYQFAASNEEPRKNFFKMLVHWREVTRKKKDLGIPNLLRALKDTGRADMAEFIMECLRDWNNSDERDKSQTAFDKWLKANIDHLDINENKDSPEPLSDLFFVVVTEMIGSCWSIFYVLELSSVEIEQTRMNPRLTDPHDQVIQLFNQWIRKHTKSGDTFAELLDAIGDEAGMCWKEDVLAMTRRWFDKLEQSRDSYANEINTVLQRHGA